MNTLSDNTREVIASGDTHFIFSDDVLVSDPRNPNIIATHTPSGIEIKPGGQNIRITLTQEQIDELRRTGEMKGIIKSPESGNIALKVVKDTSTILSGKEFAQETRYAHRSEQPNESEKHISEITLYMTGNILDTVEKTNAYKGRVDITQVSFEKKNQTEK